MLHDRTSGAVGALLAEVLHAGEVGLRLGASASHVDAHLEVGVLLVGRDLHLVEDLLDAAVALLIFHQMLVVEALDGDAAVPRHLLAPEGRQLRRVFPVDHRVAMDVALRPVVVVILPSALAERRKLLEVPAWTRQLRVGGLGWLLALFKEDEDGREVLAHVERQVQPDDEPLLAVLAPSKLEVVRRDEGARLRVLEVGVAQLQAVFVEEVVHPVRPLGFVEGLDAGLLLQQLTRWRRGRLFLFCQMQIPHLLLADPHVVRLEYVREEVVDVMLQTPIVHVWVFWIVPALDHQVVLLLQLADRFVVRVHRSELAKPGV
mmetsp:Transcript_7927/g.19688  ORF Transcript_7927/g.19688 Transcript_7927/m.19688 type:complete len:318 (+) Transcript_7927:768-1721(+)